MVSFGQSRRVTAAIGVQEAALPPEIERYASNVDLDELKRAVATLNKRILDRQLSEDPHALVAAIARKQNGK